jgi:uncharacterized protein
VLEIPLPNLAALDRILGVWSTLSAVDVTWVLAGAFAGGLVNGLTGFGTGVSALPFWVNAIEPAVAAQMAAGSAVASQLSTLRSIWSSIRWRALIPLIGAGLLGIPVGLLVQPMIAGETFKIVIGIVTCVYALIMLTAGGRFRLTIENRGVEVVIGFVSGIMGAIAGISGVLPTMWAALNDWPKERRRSMFQAFNLTILATMLAVSYMTAIGSAIYARVDHRRFDRIVLCLLLLGGIGMMTDWSTVASYFGELARA